MRIRLVLKRNFVVLSVKGIISNVILFHEHLIEKYTKVPSYMNLHGRIVHLKMCRSR